MWTVERLALSIGSTRAHVTEVLNNVPGHGGRTRRRLVLVIRWNFDHWREMLSALGWAEDGSLKDEGKASNVPRGTFQFTESTAGSGLL